MGLCSSASAEKPAAASIPPEEGEGGEAEAAAPIGSAEGRASAAAAATATTAGEQAPHPTSPGKTRVHFGSAGWAAAVAAKRKKLPKLPGHVTRQFADHEQVELEILFATHAHHQKGTGEVHMGPRGLARACDFPGAHVNVSTTNSETKMSGSPVADVFATRLYRMFGGGRRKLDFRDFAAGYGRLRNATPQERITFMFQMFDDGETMEGKDGGVPVISRDGIISLTVSLLIMASVDAELKHDVEKHGMDFFSIDVGESEVLTAVVKEWVDESFGGKNADVGTKEQNNNGVTLGEFAKWFETLSLSEGVSGIDDSNASESDARQLRSKLRPTNGRKEARPTNGSKEAGEGIKVDHPVVRDVPPPPAEDSSDEESEVDADAEEEKNKNKVMTGLDLVSSSDDDSQHIEIADATKAAEAAKAMALAAGTGSRDGDFNIEMSSGGTGYI